jgi:hypothetical protein
MTAPDGRDTNFCLGASKTGGYLGGLCPSGALPEWAASWQGAPGQETQFFQDGILGRRIAFGWAAITLLMTGVAGVN